MEDKQRINCTVESCMYQDGKYNKCTLQAIQVMPIQDCKTRQADESMCGSYKCEK